MFVIDNATQNVLSSRTKYPNIYFLPIDRPARLRPDAVCFLSSHFTFSLADSRVSPSISMLLEIVCIS